MPIVFDEIASEITPERGAGQGEAVAAPAAVESPQLAELIHELEIAHERAQRLIAD